MRDILADNRSPMCNVSFISKWLSEGPCVAGETYGCVARRNASTVMWAKDGCRGSFMCDGHWVFCGLLHVPLRVECSCSRDDPTRKAEDVAWLARAREGFETTPVWANAANPGVDVECDAESRPTRKKAKGGGESAVNVGSDSRGALPPACNFANKGSSAGFLSDGHGLHVTERYGDLVECHGETCVFSASLDPSYHLSSAVAHTLSEAFPNGWSTRSTLSPPLAASLQTLRRERS